MSKSGLNWKLTSMMRHAAIICGFLCINFMGKKFYSFVSRAKFVQTVGSIIILPYAYYSFINGEWIINELGCAILAAFIAPLVMILFTRYFNRIIGLICVEPSGTIARISHISFTGNDKDEYIRVREIIPLKEGPDRTTKGLVKLSFHPISSSNYLLLSTNNTEIVDEEKALLIFGDTTIFKKTAEKD